METKKCKACLEEKELCEFYKNLNFKCGIASKCKKCTVNKKPILKIVPEGTKICTSCFMELTFDKYRKNNGLNSYRSQCNKCLKDGIKVPPKEVIISNYKICNECSIEKPVDEFHKTKKRDGSPTTAGICKKCFNFKQNKQIKCTKCEEIKTKYCFIKNSTVCKKCNKVLKIKVKKEAYIIPDLIKCVDCKIVKPIDDFIKDKSRRNGITSLCKQCSRVRYSKKVNKSPKKKEILSIEEKTCSKCKIIKPLSDYCRSGNGFRAECKVCKKEYNGRSRDLINKASRERARRKEKTDDLYKLTNNVRGLINQAIRKNKGIKNKNTLTIVGCSWLEFKRHLESQFLSWMSWKNYGNVCGGSPDYNCSWDLDHIIPINYAKTEDEVYLLNHWSNFQPLCSKINRWEKREVLYPCSNIELNITVELGKIKNI